MAKFAYNNAKNASTGYILFELNCGYYPCISYKEDLDLHSKSKTAKKLSSKLQKLITIYQQNFYHAQKFQKRANDKKVKLQSYALSDIIWLNSKHLKTIQNCKQKAKFCDLFQVLYPVSKQAYKLELLKK